MIDETHSRARSCYAFLEGMISSCSLKSCKGCEYHVPYLSAKGRPRKWESRMQMRRQHNKRCLVCGKMKPWCLCYAKKLLKQYDITMNELEPLLELSSRERKKILAQRKITRGRGRPRKEKNNG